VNLCSCGYGQENMFSVQVIFLDFFVIIIILTIILYSTLRRVGLLFFINIFCSRLIPTLFLILCSGYQPERLQTGIYLLLYTLLASVGSTVLPSFSKDVNDFDVSVKESETTERLFPRD